jgi:hypothetical protein
MNQQAARLRLATGMNSAGNSGVLRTISLEGTAVAVWHRTPCASFQAWIDQLPLERMPALRTLVAVDAAENAVLAACASAGTPDEPARQKLAGDVATLARIFAETLAQPFLRLNLDVVRADVSPMFRMAEGRARLFCTYRGRGMQFGAARPNGPPKEILELPTCSATIFRGLLWPSKEFPGIVHRPPPMERRGEHSSLLVIDPGDDIAGSG